jgi:hypothetical protein
MNNTKKMEHLGYVRNMIVDGTADVGEEIAAVNRLLIRATDLTDRIANRRLTDVEKLLRKLSEQCYRMADEVASMKVRDGND